MVENLRRARLSDAVHCGRDVLNLNRLVISILFFRTRWGREGGGEREGLGGCTDTNSVRGNKTRHDQIINSFIIIIHVINVQSMHDIGYRRWEGV